MPPTKTITHTLALLAILFVMTLLLSGCGAFFAVTGLGYLVGYETVQGAKMVGEEVAEIADEREQARQKRREKVAEEVYKEGELKATVTASTKQVWHATRVVLKESGWAKIQGDPPKKTGELTAFDEDGEKVIVKFYTVSEEQSQIGIRIGLKGNPERSQALLDKIAEYVENTEIMTL